VEELASVWQRAAPVWDIEFQDLLPAAQSQLYESYIQSEPLPVIQVLPVGEAVHTALAEKGASRLKNANERNSRLYLTAAPLLVIPRCVLLIKSYTVPELTAFAPTV